MIVIQGKFATYGEVWFDEQPACDRTVDVLLYRQRPAPVKAGRSTRSLTLVNDLRQDQDRMMGALGNTNRYKIKRAESKDRFQLAFFTDPAPQLEAFGAFYDEFARQKGLPCAYYAGLCAAARAGQLVLTSSVRDGDTLVWHAYITHGERVALLHSASHFRRTLNGDSALVARANRWLHWRDILRFKELGFAVYDWGGLFEDETDAARAGVNNFKREFGGDLAHAYQCDLAVTLKGRAYLALRGALDRLKVA
jgi:hypothetical protein